MATSMSASFTTTANSCVATINVISSTNIGPLNTPVTFPAICTNQFNFHTSILGAPTWSSLRVGGCALSQCCPSSRFYTDDNAWYTSYFSPGVCPAGYQTCNGPIEVEKTLPAGESVRFCCPDIPYEYAYPIQIRWKDADFVLKTSGRSTPTVTSAGLSPPSGTLTPKTTKPSTGAIAGIAVSIGLVAIGVALLCLWWFRKKRRANSRAMTTVTDSDVRQYAKAEMDGSGMSARELGGNQIYELTTHISRMRTS
ncbi:hypothetical protein BCR34DRAFT_590650 [Clohesyomyces aquaticus]|uniref:Uncharacterized protein n=1 Tax=Clohesyomyces aquaticus TaxID=1231657 RepID=A0A1Y1Z7X7_9PLEO|nr:hypothetical protein BCR34DRAFT_590650 [Clohesyomyces aquaticus]